MFEEMLESSPARRPARSRSAFGVSFALWACAVSFVLLLPLIYTESLNGAVGVNTPTPLEPPSGQLRGSNEPPRPRDARARVRLDNSKLLIPNTRPHAVAAGDPTVLGVEEGPGGIPGGADGGAPGGTGTWVPNPVPPPAAVTLHRVSSGVQAAKRIHFVQPNYPALAKTTRLQGVVRLQAVIGKDGSVQSLAVLEGHPLLVEEAKRAVLQWRYEPTMLNRVPVEVETVIEVIYRLQ